MGIETSGNHGALHHTIRGTRYGGTIVPVAWYHGGAQALDLGEEWHFNRQTMVSGARLESVPYRDHPRWDPETGTNRARRRPEPVSSLPRPLRMMSSQRLAPYPPPHLWAGPRPATGVAEGRPDLEGWWRFPARASPT